MMDEIKFLVGETQNFHGVELRWGGDMTGAEMISQMQNAYVPSLIRRSSVWTFKAGKSVFLLREPNGAVWVLQEYTKAVDPSLTPDNLNALGGKLKNLPQGWKFETKVLEKDLVLDTSKRADGRPSFATTCTAPTRAAATARTPAPTTFRKSNLGARYSRAPMPPP